MESIIKLIGKYKKLINYKTYDKNEVIFLEGDICKYICIIESGEIEISTITYDGLEHEINHLRKNELFGDSLILSDDNRYLGNVTTISKTTLCLISKDNWLKILKDEEVLKCYLHIVSNKVLKAQKRIKILTQKTIRDKIMFYLTQEERKNNSNIIKIKSKEKMAIYLNIPRPSLSRELINMEKDNLISVSRREIIIKKNG